MPRPGFSVVIANYNHAAFLGEAVKSVLAQDYPRSRFELLVVDDGSTDDSLGVLEAFRGEPNVRVIAQKNAGEAAAFEAGIARATMDYVCLLGADDLYHPGKLAALAPELERRAAGGAELFLCHDVDYRDERAGQRAAATMLGFAGVGDAHSLGLEQLKQLFPFVIPAGQVYSRALIARVAGRLPVSDWRQGADMAFAWGAAYAAGTVHYLHQVLATYRLHGANFSGGLDQNGVPARHPEMMQRWPRLLHALERLVDSLALDERQRAVRLWHLHRLENRAAVLSPCVRADLPKLGALLYGGDAAASARTRASLEAQTHPGLEVVETGAASAALALRAGFERLGAEYFVLARAGDAYDRTFAERMVVLMRHRALCGVASCDFRLLGDDGRLLQDACWYASLTCRSSLFYPNLALPLAREAYTPRSGNVYRRAPVLERFVDFLSKTSLPEDVAGWLLNRVAQSSAGALRVAECLVSLRLGPGERALDLRDPQAPAAPMYGAPEPRVAREILEQFAAAEGAALAAHLGATGLADWKAWVEGTRQGAPQPRRESYVESSSRK